MRSGLMRPGKGAVRQTAARPALASALGFPVCRLGQSMAPTRRSGVACSRWRERGRRQSIKATSSLAAGRYSTPAAHHSRVPHRHSTGGVCGTGRLTAHSHLAHNAGCEWGERRV